MLEIIKMELFRLKKSVLFWVMFAVTVALPILSAVTVASLIGVIDKFAGVAGDAGTDAMNAWDMIRNEGLTLTMLTSLAQIGSNPAVLATITSAIVLSKEFGDGTTRNILLANKTRLELYFAYLIIAVIIAFSFLLGSFASTMIVVAPIFGFGELSAGQAVSSCFCSLAMGVVAVLFMEMLMCMFLFSTRKQWAAILFPLLICIFAPSLLMALATLILTTLAVKGQLVSMDSLRYVPFVGQTVYDASNIDGVTIGMNILYMAVFIAIFVVIGFFTFRKADLK